MLALTAGSLALSTSAFAEATPSTGTPAVSIEAATFYVPAVLDGTSPVIVATSPVIVLVTNGGRTVVEVTRDGAVIVLQRPAGVTRPAVTRPSPAAVVARRSEPRLTASPATAVSVTMAAAVDKKRTPDPRYSHKCANRDPGRWHEHGDGGYQDPSASGWSSRGLHGSDRGTWH